MRTVSLVGFLAGAGLSAAACSSSSADPGSRPSASGSASGSAFAAGSTQIADVGEGDADLPRDAGASGDAGDAGDAGPASAPAGFDISGIDVNKPLYDTKQDLLGFVDVKAPGTLRKRWKDAADLLDETFGVGSVWLSNQGNTAISHPHGSRKECLDGLKGMVLQTPEQHKVCGADYMVPIYKDGKPDTAKACIDVFEFPNRPCELPVVWISPSRASEVCNLEGKRLCSQDEWVLACRGNPEGPDLQEYAYGNDLDLTACHTRGERSARCDTNTVKTTWATCATDTAPAGSFPRCRSRFGVFDQHGNVAEIMKRWDAERERTVTQLKGSAFFYEKISMRPADPPNKAKYPDHCAHDPRWHVESLDKAGHMMYHLGFRCCKDI